MTVHEQDIEIPEHGTVLARYNVTRNSGGPGYRHSVDDITLHDLSTGLRLRALEARLDAADWTALQCRLEEEIAVGGL